MRVRVRVGVRVRVAARDRVMARDRVRVRLVEHKQASQTATCRVALDAEDPADKPSA
jgi:hypothetical protein